MTIIQIRKVCFKHTIIRKLLLFQKHEYIDWEVSDFACLLNIACAENVSFYEAKAGLTQHIVHSVMAVKEWRYFFASPVTWSAEDQPTGEPPFWKWPEEEPAGEGSIGMV